MRMGNLGKRQAVRQVAGEFQGGERGTQQDSWGHSEGLLMIRRLLRFFSRKKELNYDREIAKSQASVVDQVTLNGEQLWMRHGTDGMDLKDCVLKCVEGDERRQT